MAEKQLVMQNTSWTTVFFVELPVCSYSVLYAVNINSPGLKIERKVNTSRS